MKQPIIYDPWFIKSDVQSYGRYIYVSRTRMKESNFIIHV